MFKQYNIYIMVGTLILYCINSYLLEIVVTNSFLDIFGFFIFAITFISLRNILLFPKFKPLVKLKNMLFLLFFCGIFWQFITPLFRKRSVRLF